jgi:hypothetical protein
MSRDRITELASRLRDAARLQDPLAQAVIELVKLSGEGAKESLVTAEGDDMLRLQGAARHMAKLHKELTTQPPSVRAPENK